MIEIISQGRCSDALGLRLYQYELDSGSSLHTDISSTFSVTFQELKYPGIELP